MGPDTVLALIPMIGVGGFVGILALKIWTNHQLRMREMPGSDNQHLTEAVQQLHDEVGSIREDLAELHERMDFTERVLSEVGSRDAIGPGDST